MRMLVFIAAFLVAIGILVAVHEFGHYWVAKKLGFKVLRFSIGFGKPLLTRVGKDADRTEYCLAAIPLGGYVKLLDEREGEVEPAGAASLVHAPAHAHRIAVLLAGPAMNLMFASLLYAILAMVGTEIVKPVVGQVRLDSPAAAAGLQRGDEIVRVGDYKVEDTEELQIDAAAPGLRRRRDSAARAPRRQRAPADAAGRPTDRRALTEPGKLLPGLGFDLATWNADTAGAVGARRQRGRARGIAAGRPAAGGGRPADRQQLAISSPS